MKDNKLVSFAPYVTLLGIIVLLLGLAWDGILHAADLNLAAKEGVMSLENPGHLLFAGGIGLIVIGGLLFLIGKAVALKQTKLKSLSFVSGAVLLIILSGLSFSVAIASSSSLTGEHLHSGESNSEHSHAEGGHSHTVDVSKATPEQKSAAEKLATEVKTGTIRFNDYKVAEAEGYKLVVPRTEKPFVPMHYVNVSYSGDGKLLDVTKPESLIYLKMPDGKMVYMGAMFLAPKGQGPTPGGPITFWHTHDNLCVNGTAIGKTNPDGKCANGQSLSKQEMMHVWVIENAEGAFAHEANREIVTNAIKQGRSA